jgi:hypothetical protein
MQRTLRQFMYYQKLDENQATGTRPIPIPPVEFNPTSPTRESWMDEVLDLPYAEVFQDLWDSPAE